MSTDRPERPTEVDQLKRWALRKFRENLRGKRITDAITRVSSGELPNYRFTLEINVDNTAIDFVRSAANAEKLAEEKL